MSKIANETTLTPVAISLSKTAELLCVSRPTVYKIAQSKDFPSFKVGGRVLVSVAGLAEWVQRQVEVSADA